MSEFQTILFKTWEFLKIPMNIYGFRFSYWDAIMWTMILTLVIALAFDWQKGASQNPKKGK